MIGKVQISAPDQDGGTVLTDNANNKHKLGVVRVKYDLEDDQDASLFCHVCRSSNCSHMNLVQAKLDFSQCSAELDVTDILLHTHSDAFA